MNLIRSLILLLLTFSQTNFLIAQSASPKPDYSIPLLELAREPSAYTIVDRQPKQYLGHPTTVLFADGKTVLAAYPGGHGHGKLMLSRSTDAGESWQRLKTEEMSVSEVPTLFKIPLPSKTKANAGQDKIQLERVLLVTCVPKTGLLEWMWSDDKGETWSPRQKWQLEGTRGAIVALSSLWSAENGKWRGVFHDFNFDNWTVDLELVPDEKALGGFDCRFSSQRRIDFASPDGLKKSRSAGLCEAGIVSSPDQKKLALLFRPQHKKTNSMISFSTDRGLTWSDPVELPGSLTGERHTAKYASDGRLLVFFRDFSPLNKSNPSHGDWVAWVGAWDDLVNAKEGQCRIRLRRNYGNSTNNSIGDCGYSGVEVLPDGRILAITYGHWDLVPGSTHPNHPDGRGQAPYILQVRFRMDDIDRWLKDPNFRVSGNSQKGGKPASHRTNPAIKTKTTLQLARIYGSQMVLPMEQAFDIYGRAAPEQNVSVEFAGQHQQTRSDTEGSWRVTFKPVAMSRIGRPLLVRCGEEVLKLENILVGRLWICAGQSNMDFSLKQAIGGKVEAEAAAAGADQQFDLIRLFNATAPPTDNRTYNAALLARLNRDDFYQGTWTKADGAGAFSAIGWWTARLVHGSNGEPIGVVDVSVGGSPAEAWLPVNVTEARKDYAALADAGWFDHPKIGAWVKSRARQNLGKELDRMHPFRPTTLFEFGLRPWTGVPFDAVLWYQGESNAEVDDDRWNQMLIEDLVKGWRKELQQKKLPFYMVQLPEIGGNEPIRAHWPKFRKVQARACETQPHAHLIVTRDLGWGDSSDVHPPDKLPVAKRIAAAILENSRKNQGQIR